MCGLGQCFLKNSHAAELAIVNHQTLDHENIVMECAEQVTNLCWRMIGGVVSFFGSCIALKSSSGS